MINNLELLIGEAAINAVLPEVYARYRRPMQGALGLFLELLAPEYRAAILRQQAMLPQSAKAAERLALLARSCPALHKLGQSLARDRRLSAELRGHLQALESFPSSVDMEIIRTGLVRELGPLERQGIMLGPSALAEASVAVVVPFFWDQDGVRREGVFKVLKPGIVERLTRELAILEQVGGYLDQRCAEFGLPPIDYRSTFEQVSEKLRNEVRLDVEQRHLAMAAEVYSGHTGVQVPELLPFCTPAVTAMERIHGVKVTEHDLTGYPEKRLAEQVILSLIAQPILSRKPGAMFHADPHAGNLMVTDSGRLVILDWSLTGRLGERERTAMVQIMLAALLLDRSRITNILLGLDRSARVRMDALDAVVHEWLKRVGLLRPPGFRWLTGMLDAAVQQAGLGLSADLMLFRKALHVLEGVIADIGAREEAVDHVLLRQFMIRLAGEWPLRWLKSPFSRSYATRLSSADLMGLALMLPVGLSRWATQAQTGSWG